MSFLYFWASNICVNLKKKIKLFIFSFFLKSPNSIQITSLRLAQIPNLYIYIKLVFFLLLASGRGSFNMCHLFFSHFFLSSFKLLQFGQVLSNCALSNSFHTNYYRMKFDNLFYCSLKFKMNKN